MPQLSISDCIRFGWETFKKRPGILIGGFLIALLIPSIPHMIVPGPDIPHHIPPHEARHLVVPPPTPAQMLASLVSGILGIFASLGMTNFALRAHDGVAGVELSDLWKPQPFWRYLGAHILAAVVIILGLMLLIVPGIIAMFGLMFVPFLVVDRGAGPFASLQESWRITKGNKGRLFLMGLALLGLNILGVLALFVGILVTLPVTWLAITHAYRTLSSRAAYSGAQPALAA